MPDLLGSNLAGHAFRLSDNVGGEDMRDVELANDDFNVHAGIADESEDFDDAPRGQRIGAIGIAVQLDVHHLAVAGVHRLSTLDEDVVVDTGIERHDERLARVGMESTDDRAMCSA